MRMAGKLYGVGVGPGDPELMTLKAVRVIREADVVAIPAENKESCVAYEIAAKAVEELKEKEILPIVFPMTKDERVLAESHEAGAKAVAELLSKGKNVAFLTLGDPTVYSTYLYLHKRLIAMGYEGEIVSGVPSFCAAAARLSVSLGERSDAIHVLPGSYPVEEGLSLPGTKVLMKSGRQIPAVKKALLERKMDVVMAERCGMEGERLFYSAQEIPEDAGYYSLMIAKEPEDGGIYG